MPLEKNNLKKLSQNFNCRQKKVARESSKKFVVIFKEEYFLVL